MKAVFAIMFWVSFNCVYSQQDTGKEILHLTIDSTTGKFTYTEIIHCDTSLTDFALFNKVKEWATGQGLNLNRLKDDKAEDKMLMTALTGSVYANFTAIDLQYKNKNIVKDEQVENKRIVLSGLYKHTSNLFSCLQTSYTNFDVIIKCKQGKAKIVFTNFTIDAYQSSNAQPLHFNGSSLENFIHKELNAYGKPCREKVSDYTIELQAHCDIVLREFKKYLTTQTPKGEDDW